VSEHHPENGNGLVNFCKTSWATSSASSAVRDECRAVKPVSTLPAKSGRGDLAASLQLRHQVRLGIRHSSGGQNG
jgi:hypothetical protein